MINLKTSKDCQPKEPCIGDMVLYGSGSLYILTKTGWALATDNDLMQVILSYRAAIEIYADLDNWIGNEFWAEGGGDPKRFANKALGKL